MKKTRRLRIICVILLAVILIVSSLFILLPRRNDGSTGRAALMFVHEDIMFPQMDYSQLFSQLDVSSYFVIDSSCPEEQMRKKIDKVLRSGSVESLVLILEGDYAKSGFTIASENEKISDLVLICPKMDVSEFGEIGTKDPSCRVAIFSVQNQSVDSLYERLSGEDTKFTSGTKASGSAPELFLSSDAKRYYARKGDRSDQQIASVLTINSPVMQTYMANYIKNYVLEEDGVSNGPLLTWVMKTVCTILTIVAFFLYAATLPANKKFAPVNGKEPGKDPSAPTEEGEPVKRERGCDGKIRGRSIADKYRSSLNHLLALQIFLGGIISLPAMYLVANKKTSFHIVLLLWICVSLLSSAFFLLPFVRKIKNRKVRSNRSMWQIHMLFTALLAAVVFMLTLLWKGAGFLKPDIMLLVALLLSVMTGMAMFTLQLADNFFGRIQGTRQSVLDSVKFSAIRFVPMVIVFVFSIIIDRGLCAMQILLLALSLLVASFMRRIIKRGALGETLSVVLYSCLYWMMF